MAVKSWAITIGVIFALSYVILTMNPDLPILKTWTKDDKGCAKATSCFTVSAVLAVILPVIFVAIRAIYQKATASGGTAAKEA